MSGISTRLELMSIVSILCSSSAPELRKSDAALDRDVEAATAAATKASCVYYQKREALEEAFKATGEEPADTKALSVAMGEALEAVVALTEAEAEEEDLLATQRTSVRLQSVVRTFPDWFKKHTPGAINKAMADPRIAAVVNALKEIERPRSPGSWGTGNKDLAN